MYEPHQAQEIPPDESSWRLGASILHPYSYIFSDSLLQMLFEKEYESP